MEALRQRFRVRAVEEADQLEAAMLANDLDRLGWLAHSLAGTAGIFGYHRVSAAAAGLDGALACGDPESLKGVSALVEVIRRDLRDHS